MSHSSAVAAPSVPPVSQNQATIDNLLILASNAADSNNEKEAEEFCNKAIEIDATCWQAWLLKAKAVGWQSTVSNPRIEEAARLCVQAQDFAPDEEKENVKAESVNLISSLAKATISLRCNRFAGSPDEEETDGIAKDSAMIARAFNLLPSIYSPDESKNTHFLAKDAYALRGADNLGGNTPRRVKNYCLMTIQAGASKAYGKLSTKWRGIEHPNKVTWETYIDYMSNIEAVILLVKKNARMLSLQDAMINLVASKDDDANSEGFNVDDFEISCYSLLIDVVGDPIDSCSYKNNGYGWVKDWHLDDQSKENRRSLIQDYKKKLMKARKDKREHEAQEKQRRIDHYWVEHYEQKKRLEKERSNLKEEIEKIRDEIQTTKLEIARIEKEEKEKDAIAPLEEEVRQLSDQIASLNKEKARLGVFKRARKKEIESQLATLKPRFETVHGRMKSKRAEIDAKIKEKAEPYTKQVQELQGQIDKANRRIAEINQELTKDRP